jgi:hypothetical protein
MIMIMCNMRFMNFLHTKIKNEALHRFHSTLFSSHTMIDYCTKPENPAADMESLRSESVAFGSKDCVSEPAPEALA